MRRFFAVLFMICFGVAGAVLTLKLGAPFFEEKTAVFIYGCVIASTLVFAAIGMLLARPIVDGITTIIRNSVNEFSKKSLSEIIPGVIGLIVGLVVASLINITVVRIDLVGPYVAVVLEIALAYFGFLIGSVKRDDIVALFARRDKEPREMRSSFSRDKKVVPGAMKVLDTSVIIDGRISDIYRTGFLGGQLVVAGFVLEELQHIADSADSLKRNRGRAGLDSVKMMQNEFGADVVIYNKDYPDVHEVDAKLLLLAKDLKGMVVTNDYNLNKVAQVQGVKVLNINDLANAVKPVLLPGEDLTVYVVRAGKEPNQGVAYLDDGTMIVIENGRQLVGNTIFVVVTSILQTSAGRMIFAKPKVTPHGDGCD